MKGRRPSSRAAVLAATGLSPYRSLPELDRRNFAPRVRQPVLGTPPADNKLVLLEGGHVLRRSNALFRESLDWFDKYLGPVATGK